ncbi:hypothetical protein [Myroides injenensis]|uniref:hypothetical protein n=1 Tax=Myroides injenensis TaxID=1183151 RepID=UPI000287D72E|nr:hypothetical protein [Myroides injenensis]
MKRVSKIIIACFSVIMALSYVSCDNEPVDPVLDESREVGKPIVIVKSEGEEEIIREGVVAKINAKGEFTLALNHLKGRNDELKIFIRKFIEGNFPTNANPSTYLNRELKAQYSTVDENRPNYVTGFVKITHINKNARVVTGSYSMTMVPIRVGGPEEGIDPNIKSFTIEGSFENVPYQREEDIYIDAEVNKVPFVSIAPVWKEENGTSTISGKGYGQLDQEIFLQIPTEIISAEKIEEGKKVYSFKEEGFDAYYISEYGVKYSLDKENNSSMLNSEFELVSLDSTALGKDNVATLVGRYKLKLIADTDQEVTIKYGTFKVEKRTKKEGE